MESMMDYDPKYDRKDWMTDNHWHCAQVAAELMNGFHHIIDLRRCGQGIQFDHPMEMATFDFDALTRAVVLAHKHCARIGVSTRRLKEAEVPEQFEGYDVYSHALSVTIHKREKDADRMSQRHPSLQDLLQSIEAAL